MSLLREETDFATLAAFKLEARSQQDRIEQLMALLGEHGIPLPAEDSLLGASGQEHYLACRAVVKAAYELLERLGELRAIVGSGRELTTPFELPPIAGMPIGDDPVEKAAIRRVTAWH